MKKYKRMDNIRTFETKENRINREIQALYEQMPDINEEIKTEFNRFDLKLNNGGKITKEDVRSLFTGLNKKLKISDQIRDKRQEIGEDLSNVPTFQDIVNEVWIQSQNETL